MANTLWVQATTTDRQVIVSEYNEAHPEPTHEVFIAGYPDVTDPDTGELIPGNTPYEVGDTALIRQRIAEGTLRELDAAAGQKLLTARRAIDERVRKAADDRAQGKPIDEAQRRQTAEASQRRIAEDEQKRQAEEERRRQAEEAERQQGRKR